MSYRKLQKQYNPVPILKFRGVRQMSWRILNPWPFRVKAQTLNSVTLDFELRQHSLGERTQTTLHKPYHIERIINNSYEVANRSNATME